MPTAAIISLAFYAGEVSLLLSRAATRWLILPVTSLATVCWARRRVLAMALALERPWAMMTALFSPTNGAPPYSS